MMHPFLADEASLLDIDDHICECTALFFSATWKGHDGEARFYADEIDRTRRLRWQRETEQ